MNLRIVEGKIRDRYHQRDRPALTRLEADADACRRIGFVGIGILPRHGAYRALTALLREKGDEALLADLDEKRLARTDRTEIGERPIGRRSDRLSGEYRECKRERQNSRG